MTIIANKMDFNPTPLNPPGVVKRCARSTGRAICATTNALEKTVKNVGALKKLSQLANSIFTIIATAMRNSYQPLSNLISHVGSFVKFVSAFEMLDLMQEWLIPDKKGKLMIQTASAQKIASRAFLTGAQAISLWQFLDMIGLVKLGQAAAKVSLGRAIITPLFVLRDALLLASSSLSIWDASKKFGQIKRNNQEADDKCAKWTARCHMSNEELSVYYDNKRKGMLNANGAPINGVDREVFIRASERCEALKAPALKDEISQRYNVESRNYFKHSLDADGKQELKELIDTKKETEKKAAAAIFNANLFKNGVESGVKQHAALKLMRWTDISVARAQNGKIERKKAWVTIAVETAKIAVIVLGLALMFSGVASVMGAAITLASFGLVSYGLGVGKFMYDELVKTAPEKKPHLAPKTLKDVAACAA